MSFQYQSYDLGHRNRANCLPRSRNLDKPANHASDFFEAFGAVEVVCRLVVFQAFQITVHSSLLLQVCQHASEQNTSVTSPLIARVYGYQIKVSEP